MSEDTYPQWVCFECAMKAGGRRRGSTISTWHTDLCDICMKEKPVTEPRDFDYPDFANIRGYDG